MQVIFGGTKSWKSEDVCKAVLVPVGYQVLKTCQNLLSWVTKKKKKANSVSNYFILKEWQLCLQRSPEEEKQVATTDVKKTIMKQYACKNLMLHHTEQRKPKGA